MNDSVIDRIARAVLYEGYILYPYRRGTKNHHRWTFGILFPPEYCRSVGLSEPFEAKTQCLIRGNQNTRLHADRNRSESNAVARVGEINDARKAAILSMASTHVAFTAASGQFISSIDPPPDLKQFSRECKNAGMWPVLVGASQRLLEPIRNARDQIEQFAHEKPKLGIGALIILGLLVAIGIWGWPELRRTIHMHRM